MAGTLSSDITHLKMTKQVNVMLKQCIINAVSQMFESHNREHNNFKHYKLHLKRKCVPTFGECSFLSVSLSKGNTNYVELKY